MPTSFKRPITVSAYQKTPTEDLIECTGSCGGLNARGRVAVTIDCDDCDQTGYSNFWTVVQLQAYYSPDVVQRWDSVHGGLSFVGECSLKFDAKWRDVLSHTDHFYFNGANWGFHFLEDPGVSMGQPRLIYALSRQ